MTHTGQSKPPVKTIVDFGVSLYLSLVGSHQATLNLRIRLSVAERAAL